MPDRHAQAVEARAKVRRATAVLRARADEGRLNIGEFLGLLQAIDEAVDRVPDLVEEPTTPPLVVCDGETVVSIFDGLPVSGDVR